MALHSFALQTAIFTALDAASITDNPTIHDHVPADAAFPFIVVGDTTQLNISTYTSDLHENTCTIHVWSTYRGFKQVKQIMQNIYTTLHNNDISITGATLINLKQEFSQVFVENDGITRHGVMRFRAVTAD